MRWGWLLGVLVALAVATAAPVSAGRTAGSRVEKTVSCATKVNALQLSAFAYDPAAGTAAANVLTGDPNAAKVVVAVDTRYKHYTISGNCRRVAKRVPLTHRGLTAAPVSHFDDYQGQTQYCKATGRVLVHFKFSFNSSGRPLSATIAIRTQPKKTNRKSKPIGFIQWTEKKSITYYSTRLCTSQ
jgi:hypothetical protein